MRRSGKVAIALLAGVVGLAVVVALVPGLGPRALGNRVIEAFGGVTCDDERCPPDAPWLWPLDAPVSSGFRTDARPTHHGVDIVAPPGTPVMAASAGVVSISDCQARLNSQSYGCDRDGNLKVRGCGWYVKILHADRVATLYCHLLYEPEVAVGDTVTAGQVIGYVGNSGNSSEPHLHFEVQQGRLFAPAVSATAIDPEAFLADRISPDG